MKLLTTLSVLIASTLAFTACDGNVSSNNGSLKAEASTEGSLVKVTAATYQAKAINADGTEFVATRFCVDSNYNLGCDAGDIIYQEADKVSFPFSNNLNGNMLILQNDKASLATMLEASSDGEIAVTPLTSALAFYQFSSGESYENSLKIFSESVGIPPFVLLSADEANTALTLLMTTMQSKNIGLNYSNLQKLSSGEILFRLKEAYSNISYALAKGIDQETILQDIYKYGNYQHLTFF